MPGLFDALKQKAAKVQAAYNKATQDQFEHPELRKDVEALINKLGDEINADSRANRADKLPAESLNAAKALKQSLESAVQQFEQDLDSKGVRTPLQEGIFESRRTYNMRVYTPVLQNFAQSCKTAIVVNQPNLMAAPGFFNKIKATLNSVMENVFKLEPYFTVTKSKLAQKDKAGGFVEKFNAVKAQIKEEQQPDEPEQEKDERPSPGRRE